MGPDGGRFKKFDPNPSLFEMKVEKEDFLHLQDDDLDPISRYEVVYKILKDQLRNHQKELISMKEEQKR